LLSPTAAHTLVGYEEEGQLRGYMVYVFERGDGILVNDIHIREWVYETYSALAEMMTFLHTQADQIRHIIFETQDEFFHFLLQDVRSEPNVVIPSVYHHSSLQGIGLMYRVIDVPRVFTQLAERDFGGQTCRLKLTLADSFLPENAGSTYLAFEAGRVKVTAPGEYEVEARMDIAEFSSLLAGSVPFKRLLHYHLAEISAAEYEETLARIFHVADKPMCMTAF